MGLVQKKDEHEEIPGIQIIGRGEGPDGLEMNAYDLVAGESAEDIAAGTTNAQATQAAMDAMAADAADEALMDGIEAAGDAADDAGDADLSADNDDRDPQEEEEAMEESPKIEEKSQDKKSTGKGGRKLGANHGKVFIAGAVACVIVAGVLGFFVGRGGFAQSGGTGSATISEGQLDTPVASWTYNGKTVSITAKEAIESQYSLDNAKDDDGNYAVPSSETVVSYVRNKILLADAESRGITVSDDEMEQFAQNQLGTSDYEQMASSYGVTEDQAKQIVKENETLNKLYAEVVPEASTSAPTAPTEPEDGNEDTASKDYADYIIGLAGDEWDADKGTWASEDGDYYKALQDEQFTADSATYAQAKAAYDVAYSKYSKVAQSASSTWREYSNGLYAKANVQLYGLYI